MINLAYALLMFVLSVLYAVAAVVTYLEGSILSPMFVLTGIVLMFLSLMGFRAYRESCKRAKDVHQL